MSHFTFTEKKILSAYAKFEKKKTINADKSFTCQAMKFEFFPENLYSRDRQSIVGKCVFDDTYYARTMKKKALLKLLCADYENDQKIRNT